MPIVRRPSRPPHPNAVRAAAVAAAAAVPAAAIAPAHPERRARCASSAARVGGVIRPKMKPMSCAETQAEPYSSQPRTPTLSGSRRQRGVQSGVRHTSVAKHVDVGAPRTRTGHDAGGGTRPPLPPPLPPLPLPPPPLPAGTGRGTGGSPTDRLK